jgi:hypothetical protein
MRRRLGGVAAVAAIAALGLVSAVPASAAGAPSGQRMYGSTAFDAASGHFVGGGGAIEPAYDDTTGTLVYLQTPNGPKEPVNTANHIDPATGLPKNVAPIYLPVYPAGSGIDPASLNCAHVPVDNCADHGPGIAAALANNPVYAGGVLGHDHLVGIAKTGGDFNVLWEPVLILFTSVDPAQTRITTLAQIKTAEAAGKAFEVPLPQLTFHCSVVSAAAYDKATPAPTVGP